MKRTLLTLLTLAALVGCSKVDVVSDSTDERVPIDFNTVQTRAAITNASQIDEFAVWGYVDNSTLFDGEKVFKSGEGWGYKDPRYWMKDMSYSFFAVYPFSSSVSISEAEGSRAYSISFDTPADAMTDLMIASKEVTATPDAQGNYPTVDLKFSHTLSLVTLQIAKHNKNKDNTIKVTSVEFGGISKSGTYNAIEGLWSEQTNSITLTAEETTLPINDIQFHEVISGMFIPQDVNKNTKSIVIKVNYEFYITGGEGEEEVESYTATSYLPAGKWEQGKSYVYKLVLSAVDNNISFKSPEVAVWGTPNPAGTLVIQ